MVPTHGWRRRLWRVLIGVGIGILVTPPTLLLAFMSAGGGHGDYFWGYVLFPYALVLIPRVSQWLAGSALVQPHSPLMTVLFFGLPCVQFSVYGVLIGLSTRSLKKAVAVAALIGLVHVAAVAACFMSVASHEAEEAAKHAAYIKQYDTDGDGQLNAAERRAASAAAAAAVAREAGDAKSD